MASAEQELARVEASIQGLPTVVGSVEKLLSDLSELLRAAKNDPVRIAAIADSLDAEKSKLSAAVIAHTPSAEVPPETPPQFRTRG